MNIRALIGGGLLAGGVDLTNLQNNTKKDIKPDFSVEITTYLVLTQKLGISSAECKNTEKSNADWVKNLSS